MKKETPLNTLHDPHLPRTIKNDCSGEVIVFFSSHPGKPQRASRTLLPGASVFLEDGFWHPVTERSKRDKLGRVPMTEHFDCNLNPG